MRSSNTKWHDVPLTPPFQFSRFLHSQECLGKKGSCQKSQWRSIFSDWPEGTTYGQKGIRLFNLARGENDKNAPKPSASRIPNAFDPNLDTNLFLWCNSPSCQGFHLQHTSHGPMWYYHWYTRACLLFMIIIMRSVLSFAASNLLPSASKNLYADHGSTILPSAQIRNPM